MASHLNKSSKIKQEPSTRRRTRTQPDAKSEYSRSNAVAHYTAKRKSRMRHMGVLGVVGIMVVGLIAAAGVAAAAYLSSINSRITSGVSEDTRSALTATDMNEPFYMLLLGIDKDESRVEGDFGSSDSAYRTDTIILARIDPTNKKVTLISIPRDTLVDLGANGKQKINAAYSFGGAPNAIRVVEEFSGVNISHYAEIDMDGFAAIVDSIGGVDVDLPVDVKDPNYTGLDLKAGKQHLDGKTAGLLGRTRHAYDSYGGGDFYREANQRMLIGAVLDKITSSNAVTIANTVSTAASYVKTDLDVGSIISLATNFIGMDTNKDIYSGQCPTDSQFIDGVWYELCKVDEWREIMTRVDDGLPPYTKADQDATAGVAGSVGQSTDPSASDDGSSSETGTSYVSGGEGAAGGDATNTNNLGGTGQ